MEQESQQDESGQQRGQVLFAMTVIVFKILAFGLQRIIVFIFYFPATAATGNNDFHIRIGNLKVGGKCILIEDLPVFFGNSQLHPADCQGIFTVAQRHLAGVLISVDFALLAIPAGDRKLV